MSDLIALAERCEAASGPDREMDAELAVLALGMDRDGTDLYDCGDRYSIREPAYYDIAGKLCELPSYTASIDAALMLVPAGGSWLLTASSGRRVTKARVTVVGPNGGPRQFESHASPASPALALCAAALRARAAQ